jgi:hypothetical protein
MVDRCANPACRAEFKLLSMGDLYAYERPSASTEFFWLCSACGTKVELCLDPKGGISVRPRDGNNRPQLPDPDGHLRIVCRPMKRIPWHHTVPSGERTSSIEHWFWHVERREGDV